MLFLDSAALNMILIKLKRPEMVIITCTVVGLLINGRFLFSSDTPLGRYFKGKTFIASSRLAYRNAVNPMRFKVFWEKKEIYPPTWQKARRALSLALPVIESCFHSREEPAKFAFCSHFFSFYPSGLDFGE